MGLKINPLIFRAVTFPFYKNFFSNNKYNYIIKIKYNLLVSEYLNLINIYYEEIFNNNICIIILLYFYTDFIKVKNKLNNILINTNKIFSNKINYRFVALKNPLLSIDFVSKYIYFKLTQKNFSIRKVLKQLIFIYLNYEKYIFSGIKLLISGRLNGVNIAKSENLSLNKITSQPLRNYVKYSFSKIYTKNGVLGLKIWFFLR